MKFSLVFLLGLLLSGPVSVFAQDASVFNGEWVANDELSDDTDKAVEKAIKAGGGKVKWGKKEKGHYRGGPASQKLYDHLSYDESFSFKFEDPRIELVYNQGLTRVFYSDGRRNTVSTSRLGERSDYSFAGWEDGVLYVESKPLDSGYILEAYSLINNGTQLKLEMQLEPASFVAPIKLTRIFDRPAPDS
jgi:hypothetical protein